LTDANYPSLFDEVPPVAFLSQTTFGGILFDQIEGHEPEHGHVLRAVIFAKAGVILAEGDIQSPVQGILNGPVLTGGIENKRGLRRETADVIGGLLLNLVGEAAIIPPLAGF
jgi:hypothetical protein